MLKNDPVSQEKSGLWGSISLLKKLNIVNLDVTVIQPQLFLLYIAN